MFYGMIAEHQVSSFVTSFAVKFFKEFLHFEVGCNLHYISQYQNFVCCDITF